MARLKIKYFNANGDIETTVKDIYKNSYVETTLKLKKDDPNVKSVIDVELMTETANGTMTAIKNKNTSIEKEETAIRGLEELIEQDKKTNDLKSLTYHTMALNESKRTLEELKKQM